MDDALRAANEWVDLRRVVLDRGFYRVRVLEVLERHDVGCVVRARRFPRLDQGEPSIQIDPTYTATRSRPPYESVTVTRFTVPHEEDPENKQMYFVTNLPVDERTAQARAKSFRHRWGIETSYRVIGDFLAKSRSTVYSVRLFYFLFGVTLYNLRVVVNRFVTVVFGSRRTQ